MIIIYKLEKGLLSNNLLDKFKIEDVNHKNVILVYNYQLI